MHDELHEFDRNNVLTLVCLPQGKTMIGTVWVHHNNIDEYDLFIQNNPRLVA